MRKKVLIVENDETIRSIVGFILESEGYEIDGCAYTLQKLLITDADLILLDEWINLKEGHMLCKEIKTVERLAHIPVIIFSTSIDIAEIAATCNANGYIRKPFEIDVLIAEVRKFLPMEKIYAKA